ncbi:hypothetical protein MNBD_GAMMA09-3922 [hydrothermal vent metagenome]|uniref:Uncharacterized protein n=1 Tax=hydrothermal vent metagenome TaxID=652676 RepID=A0A3B0XTS2_9ZZZZ
MNAVLNIEASNRLFRPFKHVEKATFNDRDFVIKYTERARKALQSRNTPLIIEMQIYFSCVVQKRVLFHDAYKYDAIPVNDMFSIAIRTVESQSCDPDYYANNHPEKREMDSSSAKKMTAKELIFDFKNKTWIGSFRII